MTEDRPVSLPKNRIFSGAQPSGSMHLGNYLGAFRNWAKLQDDYECIYCVVDLHAITVWQDPQELIRQTREAAAAYIASGVDPKRSVLFNQSQVAAHGELAWVFNCVARIGWLNRMTQFKDKAGKNREKASAGLFVYPNLMAADILAYKASHVPVGEDQKQHLELTRDIAMKFNNDYGREVFPLVEPVIQKEGARIMSLRDGSKKMSKSDPSDASRLNLTDDADSIARKIRKAKTDPHPLPDSVADLAERPEANNLLGIYAALSDQSLEKTLAEFGGTDFAPFKKALVDLAVAKLSPITQEMSRLMNDPAEIDAILSEGADRAAALALPVMEEVRETVGFLGRRAR
ncbi:tryptophan--tRNA ligase [Iodidimonas gelatinilytica]|uniref:Tryptophan--tRNA ligase n=2 Tax=Iodidimonas TaxID=2066486 RepID=A0A5A7N1G5_9PROT|nr:MULTISPECIES: tryptophan--tRNA ligase [Iodidimonas]GEQ97445.1 tryptophan--tRNA ligase [Iodidimonas gelatinilytica]GER02111.1 tryptophan--tRNA ligase [Iodidimonas gelatinilytica]GER05907.1 tryptophan--tRNA ligase [Kordiimonadales bacterium JCM 17843]GGO07369.1 tryptophan--tRNA ligase [Iodidimonas muriae]